MGKNIFEMSIGKLGENSFKKINYQQVKDLKIKTNENGVDQSLNMDLISQKVEKDKRKIVSISLYESDVERMRIIASLTGASLSKFVRKCINEEYQKLTSDK